eukprot:TRINITY_DN378_c2_g1_i1.p1 TRINITY_DN378_c2_g1~~TRINITY_DN378_c2_g1_i1.p1  ORF type:complete len:550 (+),score=123.26 TRINITY_DN378_c2_g1_i1:108-1757(+)
MSSTQTRYNDQHVGDSAQDSGKWQHISRRKPSTKKPAQSKPVKSSPKLSPQSAQTQQPRSPRPQPNNDNNNKKQNDNRRGRTQRPKVNRVLDPLAIYVLSLLSPYLREGSSMMITDTVHADHNLKVPMSQVRGGYNGKWSVFSSSHNRSVKGLDQEHYMNFVQPTQLVFSTYHEFLQTWTTALLDVVPTASSLLVFKNGVTPLWEAPENVNGGKFSIPCGSGREHALTVFLRVLSAVAAGLVGKPKDVNGVVLSFRKWGGTVSVWNKDASDRKQLERIRKDLACFVPQPICYLSNKRSIQANDKHMTGRPQQHHHQQQQQQQQKPLYQNRRQDRRSPRMEDKDDEPEMWERRRSPRQYNLVRESVASSSASDHSSSSGSDYEEGESSDDAESGLSRVNSDLSAMSISEIEAASEASETDESEVFVPTSPESETSLTHVITHSVPEETAIAHPVPEQSVSVVTPTPVRPQQQQQQQQQQQPTPVIVISTPVPSSEPVTAPETTTVEAESEPVTVQDDTKVVQPQRGRNIVYPTVAAVCVLLASAAAYAFA